MDVDWLPPDLNPQTNHHLHPGCYQCVAITLATLHTMCHLYLGIISKFHYLCIDACTHSGLNNRFPSYQVSTIIFITQFENPMCTVRTAWLLIKFLCWFHIFGRPIFLKLIIFSVYHDSQQSCDMHSKAVWIIRYQLNLNLSADQSECR